MPSWGDLFGSESIFGQFLLWQVGGQIAEAVLGPVLTDVQQEIWSEAVNAAAAGVYQALDPATLADLVERNFTSLDAAQGEAAKSGVRASDFQLLVDNAGDAPGPEELARADRLGIITGDATGADAISYAQGIAESRLKDKWGPTLQALAEQWPTVTDTLQAYIRGQLSESDALALYTQVGGNPDYFTLLYDTRGNPPSPTELIELTRRGIIAENGTGPDVLSLEQGIAEGDEKNKWYPAYQALLDYIPPPRTVTALLKEGVLTATQAQTYFEQAGLSSTLAAVYTSSATAGKLEGSKKTVESTILTLYESHAIDAATATGYLEQLGFDPAEATFELEKTDLAREVRVYNSSINRIGTLYTGHKITQAAAEGALGDLGVPAAQITELFADWSIVMTANVKQATGADIGKALKYSNFPEEDAFTMLEAQGYPARDAWVIIAGGLEGQPTMPYPGPAGAPAVS